eukprot:Phypoly_transcript_09980.p1 GENE.Phypoly_transcript_09980~~Phypoly_transcript_09980.p1  ORF type:complete len:428 (+),score=30.54 Phypoly_transcript_09980:32-1315(+)
MTSRKVVVIDNGGGTSKIGLAGQKSPMIIPNQIAKPKGERRNYIGDQIEQCPNTSSLYYRRPIDKGFVINWDTQREIWDHAFSKGSIKPTEHDLLLTEPLFNPDSLKKMMFEFLFEHFQFRSICCCSSSYLALLGYINENASSSFAQSVAHCVIDTGYSFSHIVPFYDLQKINYAIKRINIGGKSLTNYLKELASYRHWNMMEETHIINVIKEKVCYTSLNFEHDLNICNSRGAVNTIQQLYVLPDFTNSNTGYVKGSDNDPFKNKAKDTDSKQGKGTKNDTETTEKTTKTGTVEEQILPMNNERFTVPEALFNPNNVGVNQAGIPETITQAISSTMSDLHEPLYANILITGGNVLFPNFKERIELDLRSMVPSHFNINVVTPRNVVTCAWEGGSIFAQSDTFSKYQVTKEDYDEYGTNVCKRKFYN